MKKCSSRSIASPKPEVQEEGAREDDDGKENRARGAETGGRGVNESRELFDGLLSSLPADGDRHEETDRPGGDGAEVVRSHVAPVGENPRDSEEVVHRRGSGAGEEPVEGARGRGPGPEHPEE